MNPIRWIKNKIAARWDGAAESAERTRLRRERESVEVKRRIDEAREKLERDRAARS